MLATFIVPSSIAGVRPMVCYCTTLSCPPIALLTLFNYLCYACHFKVLINCTMTPLPPFLTALILILYLYLP
jgi:hypothetical protein